MKTILLIDRELENPWGLMEILFRQGYNVIAASDGRSALSIMRGKQAVDLVIADCRTQGMNGPGLFKSLKQILPSVPLLMLTSQGIAETRLKSSNTAAFERVNKPVKAKKLLRTVRKALERMKNIGEVSTRHFTGRMQ